VEIVVSGESCWGSVTMLRGRANVTASHDMVGKTPAYEVWMAFAPQPLFACWRL